MTDVVMADSTCPMCHDTYEYEIRQYRCHKALLVFQALAIVSRIGSETEGGARLRESSGDYTNRSNG